METKPALVDSEINDGCTILTIISAYKHGKKILKTSENDDYQRWPHFIQVPIGKENC